MSDTRHYPDWRRFHNYKWDIEVEHASAVRRRNLRIPTAPAEKVHLYGHLVDREPPPKSLAIATRVGVQCGSPALRGNASDILSEAPQLPLQETSAALSIGAFCMWRAMLAVSRRHGCDPCL